MIGQDRRNGAWDGSYSSDEVLERRVVGTDEVNADVAVEGAQEVVIDGRDDGFGGGFVLEHQFAQVAVALGENRSGRQRSAFGAAGEGEDGGAGQQADDDADYRLPAEHGEAWSVKQIGRASCRERV